MTDCLWLQASSRSAKGKASAGEVAQKGVLAEIGAGLTMAWRDPAFLSMIGVTAICNLFYWSHLPILQVLILWGFFWWNFLSFCQRSCSDILVLILRLILGHQMNG